MINESFITGYVAGLATALFLIVVFGIGFAVVRPWVRMKMMGGRGSLLQVLAMRFRGSPPMMLVQAYTSLLHSGEDVRLYEVESQYVAHRTQIMDVRDLMQRVREFKQQQALAREKEERERQEREARLQSLRGVEGATPEDGA